MGNGLRGGERRKDGVLGIKVEEGEDRKSRRGINGREGWK